MIEGTKKFKLKVNINNKKYGIIATSYKDFMFKLRNKCNMGESNFLVKLEDGTEVDEDYFNFLETNEELFIAEKSVSSQILDRIETFLERYSKNNFKDVHGHLNGILQKKTISEVLYDLSSLPEKSDDQNSSQSKDAKWFEGLNTKYNSKEAVLKSSAESRMRGYLYKFKKDLEPYKDNYQFQVLTKSLEGKLKIKLYNSSYFNRCADEDDRLCDPTGLFHCEGSFQSDDCSSKHLINPYLSREQRIIFSTWNFDHIIEKSRSIIPAVKEVLDEATPNQVINADYVFELLFVHYSSLLTCCGNLKLVHIVCHDKNQHFLSCDKQKLLITSSLQKNYKRLKCT